MADPETMPVSKFKATCLAALERVRRTGRTLLITRRGQPIAQVVPPPLPEPAAETAFGGLRDVTEVLGDIVEPAVEPEEWEALR